MASIMKSGGVPLSPEQARAQEEMRRALEKASGENARFKDSLARAQALGLPVLLSNSASSSPHRLSRADGVPPSPLDAQSPDASDVATSTRSPDTSSRNRATSSLPYTAMVTETVSHVKQRDEYDEVDLYGGEDDDAPIKEGGVENDSDSDEEAGGPKTPTSPASAHRARRAAVNLGHTVPNAAKASSSPPSSSPPLSSSPSASPPSTSPTAASALGKAASKDDDTDSDEDERKAAKKFPEHKDDEDEVKEKKSPTTKPPPPSDKKDSPKATDKDRVSKLRSEQQATGRDSTATYQQAGSRAITMMQDIVEQQEK